MSYSELCDPKMDLKVGYKEILHPHILIANKTIKPAEVLSPLEVMFYKLVNNSQNLLIIHLDFSFIRLDSSI